MVYRKQQQQQQQQQKKKKTDVIQIYKSMFPVKHDISTINILYTSSHKNFLILMAY